jgi:uncharacterized membrane protein YkvI
LYDYEHTQPGTILRGILGLILLALTGATVLMLSGADSDAEDAIGMSVPAMVLFVVLALFHSLTVRVSSNELAISFGNGLIQKSFLIDQIDSANTTQNRWYNGWGIKKISGGWLFNVSGFDAVELRMKNGKVYRIGTDQPDELLAAVEAAIRGNVE